MSDLISRQAAIDAICEHYTDLERRGITVLSVANHKQVTADLLECMPSAQRKGKWIYLNGLDAFECSVCGRQMVRNIFDYCPWCGAEMRGEQDG